MLKHREFWIIVSATIGQNIPSVASNHENETCFQVGFVMGIADCIIYAGLDEIP